MRYAILADIHANLAAFQAILRDIEANGGVDGLWCLGDIVGYGPDPTECIALLRKYSPLCVVGNHDLGAIGRLDLSHFNPTAAIACRWTAGRLGPADVRYLESLPLAAAKDEFYLVHGSPAEPVMEYVVSTGIAARSFGFFTAPYCLVGHTHVPLAFKQDGNVCSSVALSPGIGLVLGAHRMIINPGAVGQPRDGDPRASYAVYHTEGSVLRLRRVPYDIDATQDRMIKAGLPMTLVSRLQEGL
jgi:diadenosine tetraphosphatase ApaH/serine/threonine PP2A family protein phosphatase